MRDFAASAPVPFILETQAEDIPEETLVRVAYLALDTIGVAAASVDTEAGTIVRNAAVQMYGTTLKSHSAPILFDGRHASIPGAAYALASQIDNLDAHDGFNPVKGHIGVAVVPSLLSLAAQEPELSGREALTALVIGYEIAARAGFSLHATVSDYHTSGAWNSLGVAAMAGRIRGLSSDTLRHALGIAEYHGPRSQMMREINNPTMLHDGSGMGALNGLSATLLAEQGFTGAPAITIEGEEVADYWQNLGRVWHTGAQYIKPYPICRWAHAAIDGAAKIMSASKFSHDEIAEIRIGTFQNATELYSGMPTTSSEAQYSLAYAVAAMIVFGKVGVDEISGEALQDRRIEQLVSSTSLHVVDRHEARFPDGRWSDVEIALKNGQILSSGDINAFGGPDDPFSNAQIAEKFMEFAAPSIGEKRAKDICREMTSLADNSAKLSSTLTLLEASPGNS